VVLVVGRGLGVGVGLGVRVGVALDRMGLGVGLVRAGGAVSAGWQAATSRMTIDNRHAH